LTDESFPAAVKKGVKSALGSLAIKIDRLMSFKAKPILRFEKKDTSRKGAKGAKFGKDILTADLRRLSQTSRQQST